ncbi:unnamed protein product [Rangifer tarandus platyrhynchus]|uniref:Uncharacterized protein n=1 Tax=Rangifer tarandus platyrhynchus TaxID=3082113 RepID=A0AC59YHX7_RANTA
MSLFQASDSIHLRNRIFFWWVLREDHCCTGDHDLPDRHNTMTTRSTSPSGDPKFNMCRFLRLPQLCSTCMAFSLVADMGNPRGAIVLQAPVSFPFFWYISVTYACYAALICLSASIIYSITYVQFVPYGPNRDRAIAATAFSCITSVLYIIEVAGMWAWYELKEIFFYKHTLRALLKVLETFVAGVIFAFLSNTSLYLHQLALEWCVAVYSVCFILAAVVLLLDLAE